MDLADTIWTVPHSADAFTDSYVRAIRSIRRIHIYVREWHMTAYIGILSSAICLYPHLMVTTRKLIKIIDHAQKFCADNCGFYP